MTKNNRTWVTEIREAASGWSSAIGLISSTTAICSIIIGLFHLKISSKLLEAILETYALLVRQPLIDLFSVFNIHLPSTIVDILFCWLAIGGMVYRTATTVRRHGVLASETGFTTWFERTINNLSITEHFASLNRHKEFQKKATILKHDDTIKAIGIEPGKSKGIFIAENMVIKSFFKYRLRYTIEFIAAITYTIILWPVSLSWIVRTPKLCHEFSGSIVLFGRKFKHGGKFGLIADLRRIFAFQVLAFVLFVLITLITSTDFSSKVIS